MTRPTGQSGPMIEALSVEFDVIDLPLIEIVPPVDDGAALVTALTNLARYEWVIVTSTNGADAVIAHAPDTADRAGVTRFAAIGERTAAVLTNAGCPIGFVPTRFEPRTFVAEFPEPDGERGAVLLARAEAASQVLPVGLSAKGWSVDDVIAYRSVPTTANDAVVTSAIDAAVVTFTAPSSVARFRELLGGRRCNAAIASIGPVTTEAALHHGFDVTIEPEQHTVAALVEAIRVWAATHS